MANFRASPPRSHKTQPSGIWIGFSGGDDFNDIAVFKFRLQGSHLPIDPHTLSAVPDLAVHCIGKIHHRGPSGQRHDFALGGEDIHGIGEKIDFDMIPKLSGIKGLVLYVQQRLQPLRTKTLGIFTVGVFRLVQPMCCDPFFSDHVHGLRSHLKLNVDARWAHKGGVQRLVAVDFRDGNVVFEFTRHGFVQLMEQTQSRVAIRDARQNESHAINIGHLRKAQMLGQHLFVN